MSIKNFAPSCKGRPPSVVTAYHPLVLAARMRGRTMADVARDVGRSRQAVRSWCLSPSDSAFRPPPRDIAKYLSRAYGVPLRAWERFGR